MSATVVFKRGDSVITREFLDASPEVLSLVGKIISSPKIIDGFGDRKIIFEGAIRYCAEIVCLEWDSIETKDRQSAWFSGKESYLIQTAVNQLEGSW